MATHPAPAALLSACRYSRLSTRDTGSPLRLRHLFAACAAGFVLFSATVMAQEETVSLNFVNADIESVVKAVALATGRNFLIDPRVKGTVNLVTGQPVPRALSYQILASALRLQGFAVIENGGVTKIVPEADAKTHPGPAGKGGSGERVGHGAQLVTQVFQIRQESATQLVAVLRPLISPNNTITAYANNNTLVITDYADNLQRIAKIIDAIDVVQGDESDVIPVRNMSAIDLAQTLIRSFNDAGAAGGQTAAGDSSQRFNIVADPRTNSLIVRSENPGKVARIRRLAASLDQPMAAQGNIHVVYLKNAEAVRVAQTLRAILSGNDASQPLNPASPPLTPPPTATITQAAGIGSPGNTTPLSSPSNSAQGLASGSLVQADAATNALIITAPDALYNNIRSVIDQLDKRRAQVHIEALIVELTAAKASEFGVQWQHLQGGKAAWVAGGTNFSTGGSNIVGLVENIAKAEAGSSASLGLAPGLNIGLVSSKANLAALLRLLETDSQANILSTPSIMTLDNEEARIVIGKNVPFITGAYAQTGTTVTNPFQTYERKDVGLSLKVKPQISEGGVVRIQIYQEASSLETGSASNPAGPITNKRSLESTVLVDDGKIIALGGLMDDQYGAGEDKVPLLGDAPVIGGLFRYETKKRNKTNLMVFLRPTIIRDADAYRGVTEDRYDVLLGAQKRMDESRRSWYGSEATPQLPPLVDAALNQVAAPVQDAAPLTPPVVPTP